MLSFHPSDLGMPFPDASSIQHGGADTNTKAHFLNHAKPRKTTRNLRLGLKVSVFLENTAPL